MVPKGRVVAMEGGARCPRRPSSTEHAFTDTAQPGAREGAGATVGLLPGSSGKTPPESWAETPSHSEPYGAVL